MVVISISNINIIMLNSRKPLTRTNAITDIKSLKQQCIAPIALLNECIFSFSVKKVKFGLNCHLLDQMKSPTSPSAETSMECESPPVVSNLSTKNDYSTDSQKIMNEARQSIMSKLKLCTSENQKRSATVPYFHLPYNHYHHHHHHNINSIIAASQNTNEARHHHNHSHHHPLSHCSECLFLRRYCGGSSGARAHTTSSSSSSSAAANNVATNNMQFSSSMATPCGPTSSPISASFTWMANPSIYDNSAIISPVTGMK